MHIIEEEEFLMSFETMFFSLSRFMRVAKERNMKEFIYISWHFKTRTTSSRLIFMVGLRQARFKAQRKSFFSKPSSVD